MHLKIWGEFMINLESNPVIAAVRTHEDFIKAISSPVSLIFLLHSSILTINDYTHNAHKNNKLIFVHIDFAEGIGKDKSGIEFMSNCGIDGIITTRANLIKIARDCGLSTVQRFFIVDSQSIGTAVETIKLSKPHMVEIMPGILPKIISDFHNKVKMPIIAGGLIESKSDIISALNAGAFAVSTAKKELWLE